MKKLLMYTVAVLMMARFAVAQNTGGDKLVNTNDTNGDGRFSSVVAG